MKEIILYGAGPVAEKLCRYIRRTWPETMVGNGNQLAKCDKENILTKPSMPMLIDRDYQPFGDGDAASRIIEALSDIKFK